MKKPILIAWRSEMFPIDWRSEFGQEGALHLEVGFGDGRYTVALAKKNPKDMFVGLEISGVSIGRALARIRREGLDNIRLVKLGAAFATQQLFARDSLEAITVNFPDPWPKDKHAKNRLLKKEYFELAASRLKPGGEVRLATDHEPYLASSTAEAKASGLFSLKEAQAPPEVFETKYALKWKKLGKPLYYQVFTREGVPPHFDYLERPETVPHALLSGSLPQEIEFSKQVVPHKDAYIIIHEAAKSFSENPGEKWLFRVSIDEKDLRQQLLIVAKERSDNELIVRLESFGDPLITKAVRGAIHAVTECLLGLVKDLSIKERNY